jgi:predicted nuclease of restriction endonuclease-like (RecB) superfamily
MNNFDTLVSSIQQLHNQLQQSAVNAVNQMLTIRNWLIGYYIVEFEQNGKDRAQYGKSLLKSIAVKFSQTKGLDERSLRRFRIFYLYYPHLANSIRGSLSPELDNQKWGTLSPDFRQTKKMGTVSPQFQTALLVPGDKIIKKLSYSHIELLLGIEEPLKRTFYEMESIKGLWSVRELKRQINSQYFERSGLSENPGKLAEMIRQKINPQESTDIIKNIYAFEFLDLPLKKLWKNLIWRRLYSTTYNNLLLNLDMGFALKPDKNEF